MPALRRREFISFLGGAAAAWPIAARAQQSATPVIGFLHLTSRDETRGYLPDFQQGLADTGYIEGKNVAIEYRWGEGHNDRLPSLIAELVRRQVSVIVTLESTLAALAAKEASHTIPIIFMQGADPVRIGLVDSLNGTDFHDSWRQAGIYTGRILNGEKPMALPVQQVTKVELCINQVTAKKLGMTVPLLLLGRADEVIE
jgi:ABC-type uncharacterized transport system substrate-binding protein